MKLLSSARATLLPLVLLPLIKIILELVQVSQLPNKRIKTLFQCTKLDFFWLGIQISLSFINTRFYRESRDFFFGIQINSVTYYIREIQAIKFFFFSNKYIILM